MSSPAHSKQTSSKVETILELGWKNLELGRNRSRARSKQVLSTVETNLECRQANSRHWLEHTSSTRLRFVSSRTKYSQNAQKYLEQRRNTFRALSEKVFELRMKQFSYTVEIDLEQVRNMSRARWKQISSTVEINLQHGSNKPRVSSNQISSTV